MPTFEIKTKPILLRTDTKSTVIRKLANLMKSAKKSVTMETPYFMPTPELMEMFNAMVAQGIVPRVLTNSPRSSDGVFAAAGYVNQRKAIARTGIEGWEFNVRWSARKFP